MFFWNSFGISVIGPGHVRNGIPNQDAFAEMHTPLCDCIVVSDGVGSCPLSDFGAKMSCVAVLEAVDEYAKSSVLSDASSLLNMIKIRFLEKIKPYDASECSATCLFSFRREDEIFLGLLGDGLVAAVLDNGDICSLSEDKSTGFSNLVSVTMSEKVLVSDWKTLVLPESECVAVLLCTDGVSDDLNEPDGFIREYLTHCRYNPRERNINETGEMLLNWPVPKHVDDKTIACMYKIEVEDGQYAPKPLNE